jgi:hypothetical protein
MPLVRLIAPASEVERMTTVAMLEAHGVACHGHGDAFNTLYPGGLLGSRNAQDILVEEDQLHLARLILAAPPQWEEPQD